MNKTENLLNATQAAKFIGITKTTFYRWLKKGYLPEPVHHLGTMYIYDKSDIAKVKKKWDARNQDMTL